MGKIEKVMSLSEALKQAEARVADLRQQIEILMGINTISEPVVTERKRTYRRKWSDKAKIGLRIRRAWARKSPEERKRWADNIAKALREYLAKKKASV